MGKLRSPSSGRRVRRPRVKRLEADAGTTPGYKDGYDNGYREGVKAGLQGFGTLFDGTSIIIPTYNQRELLRRCLNSIFAHTRPPFEVIVIDNGSTDGTADDLAAFGGTVRYRVMDRNLGFAGACNVGLMMAKGQTLMLLNNDTLVAGNWLDNLQACLRSDPGIGMVGPVTNYIGGEQRIRVPYKSIRDMWTFASSFNRHDPRRWRETDRLVGFCVLLRRETFLRIGYLDEGYELGNFEDDDWGVRVRLLGQRLMIAGDSFIHHFGSVSFRALGEGFQQIYAANERYYVEKWRGWQQIANLGHPAASRTNDGGEAEPSALGLSEWFPSSVAVQTSDACVYWIEDGKRRLVTGELPITAVKLSRVDLRRWPVGEPIAAEEAAARWAGQGTAPIGGSACCVAMLPDGTAYHLEGNTARLLLGSEALKSWHLDRKPMAEVSPDALASWRQGAPIIALSKMLQAL